jgi:hypothetical protein
MAEQVGDTTWYARVDFLTEPSPSTVSKFSKVDEILFSKDVSTLLCDSSLLPSRSSILDRSTSPPSALHSGAYTCDCAGPHARVPSCRIIAGVVLGLGVTSPDTRSKVRWKKSTRFETKRRIYLLCLLIPSSPYGSKHTSSVAVSSNPNQETETITIGISCSRCHFPLLPLARPIAGRRGTCI